MRYILFGGSFYYAKGGYHDYIIGASTYVKLINYAKTIVNETAYYQDSIDWWHILDIETNQIIAKTSEQAYEKI